MHTANLNQQLANNDIGRLLRKQYQIELQLIVLKEQLHNTKVIKKQRQTEFDTT